MDESKRPKTLDGKPIRIGMEVYWPWQGLKGYMHSGPITDVREDGFVQCEDRDTDSCLGGKAPDGVFPVYADCKLAAKESR